MQFETDVERFLTATEGDFAAHLKASYAVSETFFEAMRPTISAAFRDLPEAQRRLILSTTSRAFARQAEVESILAVASRGLDRRRALIEKAKAMSGSRRKRKVWVPHMEFAPPKMSEKKAG